MLLKIFIILTIATSLIWTQSEEEEYSDCIKQITNCTNIYSTHLDSEVLYDFYTCIVTISTCDETEDLLYRQKILKAILTTLRHIKAEEQLIEQYENDSSSTHTAWTFWNVLTSVLVIIHMVTHIIK